MKRQLDWAKKHAKTNFEHIVISDETTVKLFSNRKWIWSKRRFNFSHSHHSLKSRALEGIISMGTVGLHVFGSIMHNKKYVND